MIINFIPAMGNNAEDMDMQLWAYIDKQCSDAEAQLITTLIATDKDWATQYKQLLSFNNELSSTEPEQPSMRFSKNVMDSITATKIAPATKTYVNPWVLRGIAGVFGLLLVTVFIYILSGLNWNTAPGASSFHLDYSKMETGSWWIPFALVNIVLLIIFIDAVLRRRRTAHK